MREPSYRFKSLATRFDFGKHLGETLSDVLEKDPSYVNWCANNIIEFKLDYDVILEIRKMFPNFVISKDFVERVCENYISENGAEDQLIRSYFNRLL